VTPFEKLDPLVQHHIVNTLGWRELRPLQEQSIEPIQNGEHCLLLAPTAGGKTEAAIFPVLSRICSENWAGLSVLYICPLRALLNNLHVRLQEYCNMVGRRCGLWHGDVGESAKNQIRAQHPDILLTTPESLEVMLISARPEAREMLRGVRLVVIDEIHAFAGDDRGWHLLAVLERIGRLAGRELQRIGNRSASGCAPELPLSSNNRQRAPSRRRPNLYVGSGVRRTRLAPEAPFAPICSTVDGPGPSGARNWSSRLAALDREATGLR